MFREGESAIMRDNWEAAIYLHNYKSICYQQEDNQLIS